MRFHFQPLQQEMKLEIGETKQSQQLNQTQVFQNKKVKQLSLDSKR